MELREIDTLTMSVEEAVKYQVALEILTATGGPRQTRCLWFS